MEECLMMKVYKNILQHLDNDIFKRIKVGVGEKPAGYDLADYVLGHFTPAENKEVEEACKKAADAVKLLIQEKTDEAMNKYN